MNAKPKKCVGMASSLYCNTKYIRHLNLLKQGAEEQQIATLYGIMFPEFIKC